LSVYVRHDDDDDYDEEEEEDEEVGAVLSVFKCHPVKQYGGVDVTSMYSQY
jgi:hypothetical protein